MKKKIEKKKIGEVGTTRWPLSCTEASAEVRTKNGIIAKYVKQDRYNFGDIKEKRKILTVKTARVSPYFREKKTLEAMIEIY